MSPEYLSPLANHLWQSTLLAAVAGLLALALRNNDARVRHWVWLAASCKFLVPLSLLVALGSHIRWQAAAEIPPSNLSVVMEQVSQPFKAAAVSPSRLVPSRPVANPLPAILLGIWACGFLGIASVWWVRWQRIRAAASAATPLHLGLPIQARSSPAASEPGVFGVLRPVLLLPEGIFDRLTPAQLEAVIAHELCHVHHRDNLIAALHMFVETAFWFHPLVWWIGKRMLEERERACDEEVLRLGNEPRVYAEGILSICKLYVESRLPCVAGVSGSNLKNRIQAIMANRAVVKLTFARKAALAAAGLAALAGPAVTGMMNAPPMLAQSPPASAASQSRPASTPKFEVASIKPCGGGDFAPAGKRGGGSANLSPGALHQDCATVMDLVRSAYVMFANGHVNPRMRIPVEGGPAWINTARYRIDAKAAGPQGQGTMRGPMLQVLLEQRFQLKIHRESREVPAYALTVAKGGAKLHRFQEGTCTPLDLKILDQFPPPPFPKLPPGQSYCGGVDPDGSRWVFARNTMNGPNMVLDARALSIDDFIKHSLSIHVDRPVIDHTGITGQFDYHMEFAPEEAVPNSRESVPGAGEATPPDPAAPSIFVALQRQLGLKLEPARALRDFLVIDQVQRPSAN